MKITAETLGNPAFQEYFSTQYFQIQTPDKLFLEEKYFGNTEI